MPEPDDITLLKQYAGGDESSFTTLFERHVHLVYSAALRQARNPSHAEEVTQAVFILLARKATSLSPQTVLSGWLYQAARLTTASLIKREIRRQRREQEVYMQTLTEPDTSLWEQISPLLDDAMGRLGEKDRNAIVLRFFENRTPQEVAAALKLNEITARKRVSRALEKLRTFFAKRGVVLTAAIIAGTISGNSVQAAPATLANSATAVAIAKGATASGSILALVKATLIAMKTKTIVATAAVAVVILGIGGYLVGNRLIHQPEAAPAPPASAAPSDTLPIKLANESFKDPSGSLAAALLAGGNNNSDKFLNEIDPDTRRTTNSAPAGHIKCLVEPNSPGSADYLKSLPSAFQIGLASARYINYFVNKDSSLFGKRIRITGWMKTSDVRNWAGANLVVANIGGYIFAFDGMYDRPLHGTGGWQQIEFVTDVPKEPCFISLSPTLYGTGEMWCDDFQIDVVPADTPATDDRTWNVWSQDPNDYSETTDPNVTHNGHSALCIAYISHEAPQKYSFVWWGQHNREPEKFKKYLGHTVRMSIWAKSDYILGNSGLNLEPKGAAGKTLAQHSAFGKGQIMGTTDWAQHSITCVIPEDTEDFQTGFFIFGPGKLWLDMDSFKCEIIK
jgi:RNA polymerase sigma factor (sigma-70 family)